MRNDLKTIREHSFHGVYHNGLDKSELFMGDLPLLMMSGEHGTEYMAMEYMQSNEWFEAIEELNNRLDDPRMPQFRNMEDAIFWTRKHNRNSFKPMEVK